MDIKYVRAIDVDNQRASKRKYTIKTYIDCDTIIDRLIHEEFSLKIKKGQDVKSKIITLDDVEIISVTNFKKWYKMAYPEKYKNSKSHLNSMQLTPNNKNHKYLFSPEPSIKSSIFNLEENIEVFHNKIGKTDNKYVNKNNIIAVNNSRGLAKDKKKTIDPKKDKEILAILSNPYLKLNQINQINPVKKLKPAKRPQAEIGLRKYSNKNHKKFLNKLLEGPPDSFRWMSWIISLEIPEHRTDDQFYAVLSQKSEEFVETQIEKDLHRTLTDGNLFCNETSRRQLFNVLKAFANSDRKVAYCQGMNCIAGFILVVSDYNEIDAFYLMLSLFSYTSGENNSMGIRGFYLPEFPLLQLYLYQFDYIFYKKMPNLKKHFENLGIPNEAWVSKWFQTLYTICLPLDVVKRLWDCIFSIGLEFLFNFTLAILKHFEEDLIKFNDMIDLSEYLKSMNPYLNKKENKQKIDIEKIIEEGKKIIIPKNVLDNLRSEYEKLYNLDLSKMNMKYSIKESTSHSNNNDNNLNDSISFGDCSYIDLANALNKKESTITLNFNNEEENSYDIFDASVSSEFDHIKKEVKICDKVNMHILKLADFKKVPVILKPSSKSFKKFIPIKINTNILRNDKNNNNNTNSVNNFSNTTNCHVKSVFDGN